jgi:predicted Zn-dependent protease
MNSMPKPLAQFFAMAILFLGTWFLLSRINFVEFFNVPQLTKDNEHRLGVMILDAVEQNHKELDSDTVSALVESIKHRLCTANNIQDSSITLHILIQDDVNAFALPDRHLMVYTGLIEYCNSPEELSGVLAHEIAHMEHQHIMKKLGKEAGLSMLMTIAGGESSGEISRQVVKLLSSTAFDREQETEADLSAVHMMAKADIDPEHFANFLFRLSQEKNNISKHFELLSTHPNSQDRSAEILKLRKQEIYHSKPITDSTTWATVKKIIHSD